MSEPELFTAPADLTLLSDEAIRELETRGVAEFERLSSADDVTPDILAYSMRVTEDLDRVRAELAGRDARAASLAVQAKAKAQTAMAELRTRVMGTTVATDESSAPAMDAESIAKATAQGVTAAMVAMMGNRGGLNAEEITRRATASLGETARVAPRVQVPETRLSVVASVDIPGVAQGSDLPTFDALTHAFNRKAKSIPITRSGSTDGHVVATVNNSFDHTLDDRSSPANVEDLIRHLTRTEVKESLVAGGGWCAPSENLYGFFNIAGESGLVDLPTFGVSRGGIQFPVSPSLADAVGTNAFGGFAVPFSSSSVPFLWTEASDIATVTGSPNKPCVRVPCPTFSQERLECYGICLTAGNLTNDAYPEATQNMIRLLMSAHSHAMNARTLALMVARSTAAGTLGTAGDSAAPTLYNATALAATDYRERYGMSIDDTLEVVYPSWVREVIRADLAWKAGVDAQSVDNATIVRYFTDRNVRVQWVDDWQVRGVSQFGGATPVTAWPLSAQFMIYAAGTFVRGNGMTLDLGVVRDSVLNAENDYTAAWSEECQLVARFGHESRLYTVNIEVNGKTSAVDLNNPLI